MNYKKQLKRCWNRLSPVMSKIAVLVVVDIIGKVVEKII